MAKDAREAAKCGLPNAPTTGEADSEKCPHCQAGPEYYRMIYNLYKFDVDLARSLVADGRESLEMDEEDVTHALEWAEIYPQHLDHVNLKYPGIVAHYWYPEDDGSLLQGQVLIDGHHRAAKAQQLGIPYFIQLLTEEESRQVTLRSPTLETILDLRKRKQSERRQQVAPV